MPKLHELLAVESSLKSQAEKNRSSIIRETFEKKLHHFGEKRVTFWPLEGGDPVNEEQRDLQTTVKSELEWLKPFLVKGIDAGHQVAVANVIAKADIISEDGTVLAKDVPATSLLELEKRIREIQDVCHAIPTLDPVRGFVADPARGEGVYVAREAKTTRYKRVKKPLTLSPATDKHPANVQLIEEDVPVGSIQTQEWSGLITPSEKSKLLNKCEDLMRSIKKARSRANDVDVNIDTAKVGLKLLGFIFG